ncbi:MAG: SdiA-regulated family protein [Mucilaginibacter sp.]|nr:MAG: hypothetical protein BGO48_04315 [Mucilaginibacter sp. 44-25]PMP65310.1 MAG: SdiA-regulated family protein [Mucilaginibacter sp.]HEK20078.1 SdiA-regulated family protein [Bacteroidota bacterium]
MSSQRCLNRPIFLIIALLSIFLQACIDSGNDKIVSPPGYQLDKPQRFKMSENLLEISGIAFKNNEADTIYAVQDEDGRVFYFKPGDRKPAYTHFAKQGDYEDIGILHNRIIVLKSNGTLFTFPIEQIKQPKPSDVQQLKGILPKAEYEGLYIDNTTNKIYVLCKDCNTENGSLLNGGYIIDATDENNLKQTSTFQIALPKLSKKNGADEAFHPSALAKNPVNGLWYILSATNNLLLITDAEWRAKATYKLPHSRFTQPEGIAFDKEGNLYISNEGDEFENGNILKFTYNKPAVKK